MPFMDHSRQGSQKLIGFFQIHWIDNSRVAQRMKHVLPNVTKYVAHVQFTNSAPTCYSFTIVTRAITDKLLQAKLAFFQSLSEDLEQFLTEYQSDAPLAPFLFDSLILLLNNCMRPFVNEDIIEKMQLHRIHVMKKSDKLYVNLMCAKDIDLGYTTRDALEKCNDVSPKDILHFKQDCRNCFQYLASEISLEYPLTVALFCLNPAKKQLRVALGILLKANLLLTSVENADPKYKKILSDHFVIKQMKLYS